MVRVIAALILLLLPSQLSMRAAMADEADAQLEARFRLEQAEEQAFKEAAVLASPSIVRIDTVGGLDIVGRTLTLTAPTTGLIVSVQFSVEASVRADHVARRSALSGKDSRHRSAADGHAAED